MSKLKKKVKVKTVKITEAKLVTLKLARLIMEDYDKRYIMEEIQYLYDTLESMDNKKSPI